MTTALLVIAGQVVFYGVLLLCRCIWELSELKRISVRIDEVGAFIDASSTLSGDCHATIHRIIRERQEAIRNDQNAFTTRRRLTLGFWS